MFFEERELKPYAESVSETELQEGSVYFNVTYVDDDMLIPIVETLVFIGRNLTPGDLEQVYFQDVRSHRRGIRYSDFEGDMGDVRADFLAGSENQLGAFFEYEQALNQLLRCSLRRRGFDEVLPMRFEAQELKHFAEPMLAAELQEGEVYFALTYVDDQTLIPVMETRVFVGRNLEPGDEGKLYFQDVYSYHDGIRYGAANQDECATFYTESENELSHVFEFEKALEELMRCSLRRRNA